MLSIGLMSGTSMDGIDAAMLQTNGSGEIKALGHTTISYQPEFRILLKAAEFAVRRCNGNLDKAKIYYPEAIKDYLKNELKMLDINIAHKINELTDYLYSNSHSKHQVENRLSITFDDVIQHSTELHARAVKQLLREKSYDAKQIDVVGFHGQTLFHRPGLPNGITIQIGDGQYLAEQLGITVVNDFRSRDVKAGGQGAPFAPIYHHALAKRDHNIPVAVVNCGGIANITLINSANELDLIGFDTGPGNGLIDRFIRQRTHGAENMDADGQYGKQGKVNEKVLAALYEKSIVKDGKNYLQILPPKSLDINDMQLISQLNDESLSLADACRTLEAFTADTIVNSLTLLAAEIPKHWILAGGGCHNPVIKAELELRLRQKLSSNANAAKNLSIQTADEAGWNSQALEAEIFAYLAVRSLQNQAISVPGTTQVPTPLSGGHAYLPSAGATDAVKLLIAANPAVLDGYRKEQNEIVAVCP